MKSLDSPPSAASGFDGRQHPRLKDAHLRLKNGHKHHPYDSKKAPYPLSYDKHVLEADSLDMKLAQYLRGSISFVNFPEGPPERTLDLGCGTGAWVIDAAKAWPDCEFVGFDLVNVQIPHKLLDEAIAGRIEWRHGNFLTNKLPFDDDEFDHVHIQGIAKGVPENKWGSLFEEVNRVLRPGGSVEIIEEGAPRALRFGPVDTLLHDHALLESLHKSVFEHRFVNMNPTAVLPSYFTTYFRQVTLGPVISFPMPPMPPPQPLPPPMISSYSIGLDTEPSEPRASTSTAYPVSTTRPSSLSFSSTVSASTISTHDSKNPSVFSVRPRTGSASFSSYEASDASSALAQRDKDTTKSPKVQPFNRFFLDGSLSENEIAALPPSLLPIQQLESLSERSLAMHLYRSYQSVLACADAMWEELQERIRRKDEPSFTSCDNDLELDDADGREEARYRKKFDRLVERYKRHAFPSGVLGPELDGHFRQEMHYPKPNSLKKDASEEACWKPSDSCQMKIDVHLVGL
ncbi:hypothetical protein H0H92_002120 [Tricholoma furcatifolium]|nr:hypothetical protein H0H92_002120 [Tricholoma furcatifolium]